MRSTAAVLVLAATTAACGDDGGTTSPGFTDAQIVADFADRVAVPTYTLLHDRATALHNASVSLRSIRIAPNLTAAQNAWADTRVPWEQSEGFRFGPVSADGYAAALDAWPVDRAAIAAVIASSDPLTPAFVHDLPGPQKGFHTAELLLFGANRDRVIADVGDRELEYLTAVTQELVDVTALLQASWTTAPAGGGQAYRDVLATAGQAGNTAYPTLEAAAQAILGGMSGGCDEVADGKIAGPYDAHDPTLVESQFSFTSLADLANDVVGVRNAYTGDVLEAGSSGRGLDEIVKLTYPGLDARLRMELDEAVTALNAIPPPFHTAVTTPSSYPAIEAARAAVLKVKTTIDGDLTAELLR